MILNEIDYEYGSSSKHSKEKIKSFTDDPERVLPLLQRAIQNMLLHTHESRTYCLQGVYDVSLDAAALRSTLVSLRSLTVPQANPLASASLVYAVGVCSRRQQVGDLYYTHYWVIRVDLLKFSVEVFDSYRNFDKQDPHEKPLKDFLADALPWNTVQISHRATQKFKSGVKCLWNICKDLICLTAFRNPRILRRGNEAGFSQRELHVAHDKFNDRMFPDRIGNLCYCLIVQK